MQQGNALTFTEFDNLIAGVKKVISYYSGDLR